MKKALVIILAIITVLVVAVSLIIFVPKIANEAKINKLSAGGVKLGETTFSLNDAFEGTVNITEDNKIEFCFTEVLSNPLDGCDGMWEYNYIQAKEHLHLIGEYSVGLDKNITIDVEEYYSVLELVGSEQNIANYRDINTKRNKELFESGNRTQNEFDAENSRLNGERFLADQVVLSNAYISSSIISAKLRMDTENNKVYLISYQTKHETIEFSYYETGDIKSKTSKLFGTVPLNVTEYDINGKQLHHNSQREFYDNSAIKTETVEGTSTTRFCEYNIDGQLVKSYTVLHGDVIYHYEYEYNDDGICISSQQVGEGVRVKRDIKYLGYKHSIEIDYLPPDFKESTGCVEYYGYEDMKFVDLEEMKSKYNF